MNNLPEDFPPIAILGYGCVLPPDATSPEKLWENLSAGVNGISPAPEDRWKWRLYHSADRSAPEKTYCRYGGFLTEYVFAGRESAAEHGVTALNRTQQLAVDVCHQALDAVPGAREAMAGPRSMLLVGNILGDEISSEASLHYRTAEILAYLDDSEEYARLPPDRREEIRNAFLAAMDDRFPSLTGTPPELVIPAFLPHVVAKALGVTGPAFVVDGACAAGLLVVDVAIRYLHDHVADTVLAVGVMGNMSPTGNVAFAKIGGLSPGRPRPLDTMADGLIPAEGAGAIVLKRLDDAVAAGDPVKAVIRGIASRTDGRGKAIYAPNTRGQADAMRRALDLARWTLADVDHVEMHATGTPTGDPVEITSLVSVAGESRPAPAPGSVSIGSIKGLLGHLFPAAGMANLIKILVSMEKGAIAPTPDVTSPRPPLGDPSGPFAIHSTARPWPAGARRRRAMANAFGFGGVNTSICVEDFDPLGYADSNRHPRPATNPQTRSGRAAIVGVGLRVGAAHDLAGLDTAHAGGPSPYPLRNSTSRLADIYDPDRRRRTYPVDFDFPWREFRVLPATLPGIDRAQQLALVAAAEAVKDAGTRSTTNTAVIVGAFAGLEAGVLSNLRIRWVEHLAVLDRVLSQQRAAGKDCGDFSISAAERVIEAGVNAYTPVTTDANLPGYMDNVVPGRIGNILDLRGANFSVDAGRGSFTFALDHGLRLLRHRECDALLVGGVSANLADEYLIPLGLAGGDAAGVPAEAAVFFLLKPVEELTGEEKVYAIVEGIRARPDPSGTAASPGEPDYLGAQGAVRLAQALGRRPVVATRRVRLPLDTGGGQELTLTFPDAVPTDAVPTDAVPAVPAARTHRVWSDLTLGEVHEVLAELAAGRSPAAVPARPDPGGRGSADASAGWRLGISWETEEDLRARAHVALRSLAGANGQGAGHPPGRAGAGDPR